jgi:hypothetical protein
MLGRIGNIELQAVVEIPQEWYVLSYVIRM